MIDNDRADILRLYEVTRQGHLEGDAAKLLAQYGDAWVDLRDGGVVDRTIADETARLGDMLAITQYQLWEDVAPPRVDVSPDGSMAWLLGQIRALATQSLPDGSEREIAYRCSWLQVYTRIDGRWAAIVNAPSVIIESRGPDQP